LRVALVTTRALTERTADARNIAGRYIIWRPDMDETPEELEQIRREADQIDVYKYRRRFRTLKAIGLGAFMAGVIAVAMWMVDSRRNPCQRVRDHFCRQDAGGIQCKSYQGILDESMHDDSPAMRGNIKAQCQTKIDRLKEDDGVEVK
jgi:hypothetical protein